MGRNKRLLAIILILCMLISTYMDRFSVPFAYAETNASSDPVQVEKTENDTNKETASEEAKPEEAVVDQTLTLDGSGDLQGTVLTLSGKLPENATAKAFKAEPVAAEVSELAFDISVNDGYQPSSPITVEVTDHTILEAGEVGKTIGVLQEGEDGTIKALEVQSIEGDTLSFQTNSLSKIEIGSAFVEPLIAFTRGAARFIFAGFGTSFYEIQAEAPEGLEVLKAYHLVRSPFSKLFFKWSGALLDNARESLDFYTVVSGRLGVIIDDITDYDGDFALVKDSGYRNKTMQSGTVSLDGMLPKGVSVTASDVSKETEVTLSGNDQILAAYDITLEDGNQEYEPDAEHPVSVTISVPGLRKGRDVSVVHILDDGTEEVVPSVVERYGEITFTATGFSVYVVIDHEGGALITPRIVFHYINYEHTITYPGGVMTYSAEPYNFLDESNEYLADQIVKSGETLLEVPTPPVYNQQYFNGWYVVDMEQDHSYFNTGSRRFTGQISYTVPNNPTRQVFNEVINISMGAQDANGIPLTWTMNGQTYTAYADEEGCAHVYLAPLYANFNYVNFYDYDGNLIARKLLVLDSNGFSSMVVSDMDATSPIETNHYFMGWSSKPYRSGSANQQTAANTIPLYKDGYKETTYITLYGGLDYSDTMTLDIYYGGEGYTSVSELSGGTLKFDDFDTSVSGGDVNFYAEYENAHWLRFIAGESGWGALYVPADYLVGNASATTLPTTSRSGYQFAGWYTGYQDSNGAIWYYEQVTDGDGHVLTNGNHKLINYAPSDGNAGNDVTVTNSVGTTDSIDYVQTGTVSNVGLQMTADSYLFARWTSNETAEYKVIIWQQKVTDAANQAEKHYEFQNSYTETAPATTLLTLPANSDYLNRDYHGFHLGHYDQNVWIDPQGTSVVNVYYDRDVHTYLFRVPGSSGTQYTFATDENGTQFGYVDGQYVELVRGRQIGTTTEYFLTQTNGGTTEYTGTVYDNNGNTVTDPVYGTTYYRTRNTNWWGGI